MRITPSIRQRGPDTRPLIKRLRTTPGSVVGAADVKYRAWDNSKPNKDTITTQAPETVRTIPSVLIQRAQPQVQSPRTIKTIIGVPRIAEPSKKTPLDAKLFIMNNHADSDRAPTHNTHTASARRKAPRRSRVAASRVCGPVSFPSRVVGPEKSAPASGRVSRIRTVP